MDILPFLEFLSNSSVWENPKHGAVISKSIFSAHINIVDSTYNIIKYTLITCVAKRTALIVDTANKVIVSDNIIYTY